MLKSWNTSMFLQQFQGGEADPDTCAAPGWCLWEVSLNPLSPWRTGGAHSSRESSPRLAWGSPRGKTSQDPTSIHQKERSATSVPLAQACRVR